MEEKELELHKQVMKLADVYKINPDSEGYGDKVIKELTGVINKIEDVIREVPEDYRSELKDICAELSCQGAKIGGGEELTYEEKRKTLDSLSWEAKYVSTYPDKEALRIAAGDLDNAYKYGDAELYNEALRGTIEKIHNARTQYFPSQVGEELRRLEKEAGEGIWRLGNPDVDKNKYRYELTYDITESLNNIVHDMEQPRYEMHHNAELIRKEFPAGDRLEAAVNEGLENLRAYGGEDGKAAADAFEAKEIDFNTDDIISLRQLKEDVLDGLCFDLETNCIEVNPPEKEKAKDEMEL